MVRSYRNYEVLDLALRNCYNSDMANSDPILANFCSALDAAYGDRLDRVVLFGSRARGDNRPDSDYDVAVFIHGMESFYQEGKNLSKIETAIARDTGAVINSIPFSADAPYPTTILMSSIRQEGVTL